MKAPKRSRTTRSAKTQTKTTTISRRMLRRMHGAKAVDHFTPRETLENKQATANPAAGPLQRSAKLNVSATACANPLRAPSHFSREGLGNHGHTIAAPRHRAGPPLGSRLGNFPAAPQVARGLPQSRRWFKSPAKTQDKRKHREKKSWATFKPRKVCPSTEKKPPPLNSPFFSPFFKPKFRPPIRPPFKPLI